MGYRVRVKIAALLLLLFTMSQVTAAFAHPLGSVSKSKLSLSNHSQRLAGTYLKNPCRMGQAQRTHQNIMILLGSPLRGLTQPTRGIDFEIGSSTTSTHSNRYAQKQAQEQAAGVNQHHLGATSNDSDCCGTGCSSFMSVSSQLGSAPITSKKTILDNYWYILPAKQADNLYRPPIIS